MNNNLIKRASGKVLLSGEYAVLDGCLAIGLPTKYGQVMAVTLDDEPQKVFTWTSLNMFHEVWFEAEINNTTGEIVSSTDQKVADTLNTILRRLIPTNPEFWSTVQDIKIKADYPLSWGLGSSSTLIYLLAEICEADPYALQYEIFGGSAYDIACAQANKPILYQKVSDEERRVKPLNFLPKYPDRWAFIYLGEKQDTCKGIAYYRSKGTPPGEFIDAINAISTELSNITTTHQRTIELLKQHENVIASFLELPKVQDVHFPDFDGVVKSLGAWGGDFAVAVRNDKAIRPEYFYDKGFPNVLPYTSLIMK